MDSSSWNISCSQKVIGSLAVVVLLCICGCEEFFAQKPTELQVESMLSDLSKISLVPDANIPVPDIYKAPSQILETKAGVKLFYFTRYHTVDKLSGLIKEQLGYTVSQIPATNQLVINCPTHEDAETSLEFLNQVDVPPIQVKIDCLISELYADVTMDRETTIKIENLFGEKITLGGKIVKKVIGGTVYDVLKPAFPGASLRDEARELMGLKVGYSRSLGVTGHEFRALIDLLISRGYLKILMNPTLEVLNGETAYIEARDFVPLPKEVVRHDVPPYMTTEYQWVVDSLEITPYVFADGFIGLETKAQIGSKSTPEGVKQIPIITERTVRNKENRIREGESLIIGGIKKSEKRSVVRGVPVLKDIPLIGILFSSKDFEERAKEVIFILTPTISVGGIPNKEMVEKIKRKHEPLIFPKAPQETTINTFGLEAEVEKEKVEAEAKDAKEEAEKADAEAEKPTITRELKQLLERLRAKRQE